MSALTAMQRLQSERRWIVRGLVGKYQIPQEVAFKLAEAHKLGGWLYRHPDLVYATAK